MTTSDIPVCLDCGQPHVNAKGQRTCLGHVVTDRASYEPGKPRKKLAKPRPCQRMPSEGGVNCIMHGASAPGVKKGNARRAATAKIEADAAAMLALEGIEGVDDPIAEIGKLASASLALNKAAGARLNAANRLVNYDKKGGAQLTPEAELFERSLDRSMKFLEVVVKHSATKNVSGTKAMLAELWDSIHE